MTRDRAPRDVTAAGFFTIVVAPDKFKGSLTALEAARAMERGVRRALGPDVAIAAHPIADGGDGTVAAFLSCGYAACRCRVSDALGRPIEATYARSGGVAVVETAAASGLASPHPPERDAGAASSAGTGELVRAAIAAGATRIVLGVGGSATTDGGAGLLAALGLRLRAADGSSLLPGGLALEGLASVERGPAFDGTIGGTAFDLACDVDAPLLGPRGAAAVFAPQKGAAPATVARLEAGLARYATLLEGAFGRSAREVPGAGAGGGIGFGALVALEASMHSGFALVAEATGLRDALRGASLCLTGEGRIDAQTLGGKAVAGVAALAAEAGVPTIALAARVESGARAALLARGVERVERIVPPGLAEREAFARAAELLEEATVRVVRSTRRRAYSNVT